MDRDNRPAANIARVADALIRPPSSLNARIPGRSTAGALHVSRPAVSADRPIRADYKAGLENPTIGDLGGLLAGAWKAL